VLRVLAITLDQATTAGLIGTAVLAVAAVLTLWLVKSVVQKLVTAVLLGALAFAVWTQRAALEDCADKVQASVAVEGTEVTIGDTDCTFFGFTVTVSDPRSE
jgi:predicted cation transporter